MTPSTKPTGVTTNGFWPVLPEPFPLPVPDPTSCANAACHEHSISEDGRQVRVWSSRYPENGFVVFDRDEWNDHIRRVEAGELHHTIGEPATEAVPI